MRVLYPVRASRALIPVALLVGLIGTVRMASTMGKDHLTVVQATEVITLDPQQTLGIDGTAVLRHVFNSLVFLDARGNIVPDLAERWEVASDQVTWTFHLRKDVQFHDGSPFNAEAVRFTIERAIGPGSPASPAKRYLSVIDRVEVVNDATVRIVTKGPSAPFLSNLAQVRAAIMSPSAVEKAGTNVGHAPVGTGPFRLAEWRRGDKLVLERNDAYFGDKAGVRRIVYRTVPEAATRARQLETGEADIALRLSPFEAKRLGAKPGLEILRTVSIRPVVFYLNTRKKPFNDVRVRRAVNLAVDRKELIQNVLSGEATPLDSPLAAGLPGHVHVQDLEYDPARARGRDRPPAPRWLAGQGGARRWKGRSGGRGASTGGAAPETRTPWRPRSETAQDAREALLGRDPARLDLRRVSGRPGLGGCADHRRTRRDMGRYSIKEA